MCSKPHPFEQRGLGKAPFTYVGMTHEVGPHRYVCPLTGAEIQVGSPGQPMGTCDYCGQGIAYVYRVKSADGRTFRVGSDCVAKVYREYNGHSKELSAIMLAKKQHDSMVRRDKLQAKRAKAVEWLKDHKAELEQLPNVHREGETLWDQAEWYIKHAGAKGVTELAKYHQSILEKNKCPQ